MGKLIDTSFIPWASSGASSKSGRKKPQNPTQTKQNTTGPIYQQISREGGPAIQQTNLRDIFFVAWRVNSDPGNVKKSVCFMKLPQSINLGKFGFISTDVWAGNQVKNCEQKVRQSMEDGIKTGPMEALIILVIKWACNIFMGSFLKVPEALRVELTSKRRKVDEKAQNLELVAEKTKMRLCGGR